jgi:NAD(P)-dependent dehydrogenase (short-subunit alcohol dehydrogenase family)
LVKQTREKFGRLDILIPNAGIMPALAKGDDNQGWHDSMDVMLTGVWNTLRAGIPLIRAGGRGGSIVIISSLAGLKSITTPNHAGSLGYMAAKHGVIGLMRGYANILAPEMIRVNTIHPTGVNTQMIVNEAFNEFVTENPEMADVIQNALPVQLIEPQDTTNAIRWLVSDAARYVTGITLPVDAGFLVRA